MESSSGKAKSSWRMEILIRDFLIKDFDKVKGNSYLKKSFKLKASFSMIKSMGNVL